jgi:hypothetical protein
VRNYVRILVTSRRKSTHEPQMEHEESVGLLGRRATNNRDSENWHEERHSSRNRRGSRLALCLLFAGFLKPSTITACQDRSTPDVAVQPPVTDDCFSREISSAVAIANPVADIVQRGPDERKLLENNCLVAN